jgi:hypothetical protein
LERKAGRRSPTNKCFKVTENQLKVMPDLRETPFQTGFHFFVGGSSQIIERNRHNGWAFTIIESC